MRFSRHHGQVTAATLDLSKNRIRKVAVIPAGILLSLAENELPLSFEAGVLTKAVERGIRLDLTNVNLAEKAEAQELLRQGKLSPTAKRVADDADRGFSCYGLKGGDLDITPSLFLPELCGCLPGWQGTQVACTKCGHGSLKGFKVQRGSGVGGFRGTRASPPTPNLQPSPRQLQPRVQPDRVHRLPPKQQPQRPRSCDDAELPVRCREERYSPCLATVGVGCLFLGSMCVCVCVCC